MKNAIEKLWYTKNIISVLLLPLSWLFRILSSFNGFIQKKFASNSGLENTYIIIVGNITVGGAGKTPFVTYITEQCKKIGLKVGIISRGYKRKTNYLMEVLDDSLVEDVGDEVLMLKQQTSIPMAVSNDRREAAEYLIEKYNLDVIVSDDGLQHYKLPRNYEIAIVDGEREFGNHRYLPAGPLREPISRLNSVDIVVSNGVNRAYAYYYTAKCDNAILLSNETINKGIEEFCGSQVHAVAGIGYPKRFFSMLEKIGIRVISHAFADHYDFEVSDLEFDDDLPILITEKDAVKCRGFPKENIWYIPIQVKPNAKLEARISSLLEEIS